MVEMKKGIVYISDTLLRNYTPQHIKPISNIKNITCGCETCISFMLLQCYLNKWWLRQFGRNEKLYLNATPPRILKISKKYHYEYKLVIPFSEVTKLSYLNRIHVYIKKSLLQMDNLFPLVKIFVKAIILPLKTGVLIIRFFE